MVYAKIDRSPSISTVKLKVPKYIKTRGGGGGGGGSDISYIRRLGSFFGVQNFEFQYLLGFSEKIHIFWGMKILWIFFWGSSQNWTIFRGHFYAF